MAVSRDDGETKMWVAYALSFDGVLDKSACHMSVSDDTMLNGFLEIQNELSEPAQSMPSFSCSGLLCVPFPKILLHQRLHMIRGVSRVIFSREDRCLSCGMHIFT